MNIPFVDLESQYQEIKEEIQQAINDVLDSKEFVQGRFSQKMSQDFLEVHGGKYGVGCANGTTAITLALRVLKIGEGDDVLVPNNTFIGTIEPIVEVGANPVLIDCIDYTYGMNLDQLEKKISKKTKAIIPVHLYGNPENMNRIMKIAGKYNLKVIEDCAQAHCAKIDQQPVGTFGDMATFSFYPGKNLGAYGDAGFVMANRKEHIELAECLLNHGRKDKYLHEYIGYNFRIDGIQSAILSIKSKYLSRWTQDRQSVANQYNEQLKNKGFHTIQPLEGSSPVYHLYVVQVLNRDEVISHMKNVGISVGIHYPVTMNMQPCLQKFGYFIKGKFPMSEKIADQLVSLPIYPELTKEAINEICRQFLSVATPPH